MTFLFLRIVPLATHTQQEDDIERKANDLAALQCSDMYDLVQHKNAFTQLNKDEYTRLPYRFLFTSLHH